MGFIRGRMSFTLLYPQRIRGGYGSWNIVAGQVHGMQTPLPRYHPIAIPKLITESNLLHKIKMVKLSFRLIEGLTLAARDPTIPQILILLVLVESLKSLMS